MPGGRCVAVDGNRSSAPAAVRRSGDAVRRKPVSAIQRPSYSDFIDERQATKEATMNSTAHRAVSRLAAVALAAVVTLATLAGLDGLAQADSTAHLARATAAATRG